MNKEIFSEKLMEIDKEFKKEKSRKLFFRYFIRLLIIIGLLVLIFVGYVFFVGYGIQKKLTSHKGVESAKKVLSQRASFEEPFNVLLMGSDTRGEGRGRSDTLIVMRVIPKERKAFLISIPRDYRVEIPGYGKRKINAAFALGGSELAIKTVSNYLGIDVHHYAIIDFQGFMKVVDALGGITVDVEKRLYEAKDSRVDLYPGVQRLNGEQALAYVRFRHDEEGDFGRIRRQQQFLKAVADELLKPQAIPKYPRIANIIAENLETDLSIRDMISLARYFASNGGVKFYSIMLPGVPKNIGGVSFVVPDDAKVQIIVKKIMSEGRLPSPQELLDPATINVKVFNGVGKPGLARAVSSYLKDLGFNVYGSKNADRFDYGTSLIIYKKGHENEAKLVKELFGFGELVEANETYEKMLGGAFVGVIAGSDSLNFKPVAERIR
ncbi:MAG: LCP family protein [Actinobacteria bacterium]|nr:LCP family protein [Actinomycetota bacterium]